jgi:hypothetical protein
LRSEGFRRKGIRVRGSGIRVQSSGFRVQEKRKKTAIIVNPLHLSPEPRTLNPEP